MTTALRRFSVLVISWLACSSIAWAEEPEHEGHADKGKHCLNLNSIRQVEIINNRNILFHVQGGKRYMNVLPRACPGLLRHKTIMYRTSLNQLCDLDIITVMDDISFGMMPGASCGLGLFYPVDDEDIEDLKEGYPIERNYEEG